MASCRRHHHHRGTAIGNPFVRKTTCRKWLPAGHEPPRRRRHSNDSDVVSISFRAGKAASASGSAGRAPKCMTLGAEIHGELFLRTNNLINSNFVSGGLSGELGVLRWSLKGNFQLTQVCLFPWQANTTALGNKIGDKRNFKCVTVRSWQEEGASLDGR